MSTIQSSADLQSACVEWLARDQDTTLIARIPTFIQFFEAKMNRTLFHRKMEIRATDVTDPALVQETEYVELPPDFQTMRRIRLASEVGKPSLAFLSGAQMDEMRTTAADVAGIPRYFTVFGDEIELFPTPAAATKLEMIYRANLPSLTTNDSNWLLLIAPDAYLYGTLLESAPYIKQDERIQVWGAAVISALNDLNNIGSNSSFNAGPLQVRASQKAW